MNVLATVGSVMNVLAIVVFRDERTCDCGFYYELTCDCGLCDERTCD